MLYCMCACNNLLHVHGQRKSVWGPGPLAELAFNSKVYSGSKMVTKKHCLLLPCMRACYTEATFDQSERWSSVATNISCNYACMHNWYQDCIHASCQIGTGGSRTHTQKVKRAVSA